MRVLVSQYKSAQVRFYIRLRCLVRHVWHANTTFPIGFQKGCILVCWPIFHRDVWLLHLIKELSNTSWLCVLIPCGCLGSHLHLWSLVICHQRHKKRMKPMHFMNLRGLKNWKQYAYLRELREGLRKWESLQYLSVSWLISEVTIKLWGKDEFSFRHTEFFASEECLGSNVSDLRNYRPSNTYVPPILVGLYLDRSTRSWQYCMMKMRLLNLTYRTS